MGPPRLLASTFVQVCEGGTVNCMSDCELLCLDLPKAEEARAAQPPLEALEAVAQRARALSDPTRLAVALALRHSGSACGCDVAWILGRDDKLISHHLRTLKAAGAATSKRVGKMVMYELTPACEALLDTLAQGAPAEYHAGTSASDAQLI